MAYNANILLGRISKVHGFEGAVTVKLEKTFIENIPDMESVFLEIEGKPVPFFIAETEYPGSDILRIIFNGYDSPEKVKDLPGCRVFLTRGGKNNSGAEFRSFTDFKVFLADRTLVGTIREIFENPGQWLLGLNTPEGKELLIPFHEDLIVSIDERKKIIIMDLPEGLTDLD